MRKKKYPIWNEDVETSPRDGLRMLQLERMKHAVRHVYNNVAYYRERCDQVGVKLRRVDERPQTLFLLPREQVLVAGDVLLNCLVIPCHSELLSLFSSQRLA